MTNRPVLTQLNLVTRDTDASVAFYRALGLEIPDAAVAAAGGHHVEVPMAGGIALDLDSPTLASAYNAGFDAAAGRGHAVIGFSVESRSEVDEIYARLVAAGHRGMQEPHDAFWGARYAIVEDPDGNHVGLMSPVDDARRGAPPPLPGAPE